METNKTNFFRLESDINYKNVYKNVTIKTYMQNLKDVHKVEN